MFEREGFIVLSKAQVVQLLKEVAEVASKAFIEGTKVGREDAKEEAAQEAFDAGYEQGYDDGRNDGYRGGMDEATDMFGDDWDEGYAEGHEAGYIEAELRCAEVAAFEEEPRIHSWIEGGEQIG